MRHVIGKSLEADDVAAAFSELVSTLVRRVLVYSSVMYCGLHESYDSNMIVCEQCQKWFHFKRLGLNLLASYLYSCCDCQ